MTAVDVAIIGGGVMGLLSARELAARGLRVTVVERATIAGEASWAGGGIVSPLYPWRYADAITALATPSQQAYLDLAPALLDETGIDPELRRKGLLMQGVQDRDAALDWAKQNGAAVSLATPAFAAELEPHIGVSDDTVLWMPEVCSIRNPRLGQALRRSLECTPRVTLRTHASVTQLVQQGSHITALQVGGERIAAGCFLVCAGAWSAALLQSVEIQLPIEPVKGQMLLFKTAGGLLDRVVLRDGRYLIPRNDGRILVGSTLERAGFDKQVTQVAQEELYASALQLLPALKEQTLEAQWSGLRPGSPGGVPYIGALPVADNLFINAGQFRNGLVLAPASCRLAAELICGESPCIDPAPYQIDAPRGSELL